MDARKKRALLACIEGQLAALGGSPELEPRRRQRIERALCELAAEPQPEDVRRLTALRELLDAMDVDQCDGVSRHFIEHRRTLARADCLLWQMSLRHAHGPSGVL